MTRFILPMEIWAWDGWIVEGTPEEFAKLLKMVFNDDADFSSAAGGVYVEGDGKPWVLWTSDKSDYVILAHEALHIVLSILDSRGVELNDGSEETFCYTLQYILQAVKDSSPTDWDTLELEEAPSVARRKSRIPE